MSEPQPEYVWAFSDEKPKRGRGWLIVVLVVVAVAIAAALFWLFLRPGSPVAAPTPSPTASDSPTPTATPAQTGTPTPTSTASSTTSPDPVQTPPPPASPDLPAFRSQVSPVLADGEKGLGIAADSDSVEAAQTIDLLQQDAGRLSDTPAPAPISQSWSDGVAAYANALQQLRAAYERGDSGERESSAARGALMELNDIVAGR